MKIICSILLLFSALFVSAQNDYDERLLHHFSSEQLDKMVENSPAQIEFWTYYLDFGYSIGSYDPVKHGGRTVEKAIPEDVNLFEIGVFPKSELQVFHDSERGITLTVLSTDMLIRKFNNLKSN